MTTRIKFSGMTRVDDALAAAALGVDAIGVVLTPRSKRCVSPRQAREIQRALPPFVTTVALFMDDEPGFIAEAVAAVQPDLLQFHGSETLEDCVRYDVPYVKAIAMGGGDQASALREHSAAVGFLFDAHAPGEPGGIGRAFDWSRIPRDLTRPLILARGLTAENVATAIRTVAPFAVDVASGIESAPGIKDTDRMRRFVAAVRESGKV
jgi:phosphoribosylanthranilate isomerase